ncbi:MAG: type II toxin-antitoxin system Phd/YefM family antitoxin [Polaromonas sp.]|nr:type II toxin-antitoxin system Phd/YefM family antitoxin [Polaromonas sp.]
MSQVQLAEVKNRLSEYVKAVQTGAQFEITVRGVPVAQLMPISQKQLQKEGLCSACCITHGKDKCALFRCACCFVRRS